MYDNFKMLEGYYGSTGAAFKTVASKGISDFLSTFSGKILTSTAAIMATYKAIDYLQSGWTRAGEAAEKAKSEFENANSELESLKSQKEEQKTRIQKIATKYNVDTKELQNANGELKDVDQMIGVINSHGGISIVDKGELDGISSANSQLEAQLAIQEQITEAKKQAMILATEKAASTEKTYYEQMKEEYGTFQGFFKWVQGRSHFEIDKYGNQVYKGESDADKFYGDTGDSTTLGLFKTRLSELKEYKEELKAIDKEINESKKNGDEIAQDTIDRRNELVDSITNSSSDLAGLVDTISSQMEILSQSDSDFAVSWVKDAKESINDFNTIDLSPTEKNLKQIESYFNGSKVSNNLKDQLLKAVKSGKSATDALHEMGITLNDLGITGEGRKAIFDDYFSGLVESAEEAQQAINSIDGSVDGVKAAFESENKDADWNSMSEYLKQAEEIYKETSKVGTDDFKAAVQFISPDIINPDAEGFKYDADAYVAAWENAREKVKRYFDSENPITSATNFTNDLIDKGLASKAGDDITWGFENSAEAAKALEISVEATEVAMRNLESYGAEFDDVMLSGEGLKRYENALNGIKSLRDSMEEGESKKKLSGLIGNWDSELAGYQNDLSTLTEDQIVKIEFQYDLASIRSEIEELQNEIDSTGGDTKEWGSLNSKKRTLRDKLASQDEMSGATDDSGYQKSLEKLDGLSQKLKSEHKELGEDGRREIQLQQSAILDLQSAYLEAFSSGQAVNWEEFLGSKQIDDVVKKISQSTGLTKDEIGDLVDINWESLSKPIHLKVDGEFQAGEIESKINELSAGSTITFRADVSGVESEVQVLKNEDGTLTYTANVDGVQTQVLPMLNQDGTVDYILGESPEEVPNAEGEADFTLGKHPETAPPIEGKANYSGVFPAHAPSLQGVVTYRADFSMVNSGGGVANKIVNIGKSIGGGKANGTLLPAHANGTGYNVINYRPAYSDGKISLSQDEEALVNELGIQNAPMCTHRKSI